MAVTKVTMKDVCDACFAKGYDMSFTHHQNKDAVSFSIELTKDEHSKFYLKSSLPREEAFQELFSKALNFLSIC